MPKYTVKVKWGKETFPGVEVDTSSDVIDFKAQVYALSNVPVERQKLMSGGKTLKDDEWNITLKNVSQNLLFLQVIPPNFLCHHFKIPVVILDRKNQTRIKLMKN